MRWDPQQDAALKAVDRWLKDGDEQVFRLFGYAGSGKTTLIKHVREHFDGEVAFLAFTGKAASVMRVRGCQGARTIHSFIYLPPPIYSSEVARIKERMQELRGKVDPAHDEYLALEQRLRQCLTCRHWILRQELDPEPDLIIVDEVSMVNEKLATDLLSFGCKVLVIGDPAQLPPVYGAGYFMAEKPDVMLTEVHRHALDSPALRMATQVRQHGADSLPFDGMFHFPVRALGKDELRAMATAVDQILVGRHVNRRRYNEAMRRVGGFSGSMPNIGEVLCCCRNNSTMGLLNGTLWRVLACVEDETEDGDSVFRARLVGPIGDDNAEPIDDVIMDCGSFFTDTPAVVAPPDINIFVPGYTITAHKAQGSEWPDVLIVDDWRGRDRDRWMYTAITRARDRATVVSLGRR
jgi:ATP-dependent exoDNAse (exonuclease V) alpha subunit